MAVVLAAAACACSSAGQSGFDPSADEVAAAEPAGADKKSENRSGCASGCMGCAATCAAKQSFSLDDIVKMLRRSYSDLEGLSMSFQQVNSWKDMPDAGEISKGVLWAAGGRRLRLEYSEPPGHLLVSDGERIWVYVPENKQAVVDTVGAGEGAALAETVLSFLDSGRLSLAESEKAQGTECYVLLVRDVLEPPGLETVKIWVDPGQWLARGIELTDVNGNVTTFVFSDVKRLKKVDEDRFTFEAPPGVEVVESPLSTGDSI